MNIISVVKKNQVFFVKRTDNSIDLVPDDLNNLDRQELEVWIKSGGIVENKEFLNFSEASNQRKQDEEI